MLVGRRAPRAIEPGGLVIWPGPAPGLRGGVRGQARRWAPGSEVRVIGLALAIGPTMLRAAPTKERITSVTGTGSSIKRSLSPDRHRARRQPRGGPQKTYTAISTGPSRLPVQNPVLHRLAK